MDVNSLIFVSQLEARRHDRMEKRAKIAEAGGSARTLGTAIDGTRGRRFLRISMRAHLGTTLIAIGERLIQRPGLSRTGIARR